MAQYFISKAGNLSGGATGIPDAFRAMAQQLAKTYVVGHAGVTDNSAGVPSALRTVAFPAPLVDTAASGSNLATKATVDASLAAVQNAIKTLYVKALAAAALLGVEPAVYNGGGTDGAGTVAAIGVTIAGATTGPAAASVNPLLAAANGALYDLAAIVRKITIATGDPELVIDGASTYAQGLAWQGTIPSFGVTSGTAGATGVTAASMAAALASYANNIATIAAALNAVNTAGKPAIRAVS